MTGEVGEELTVEVETPLTVDTTYRRVLEEGDGDPVEAGQTSTFQGVGVNGRDGNEFDNSYEAPTSAATPTIVMDETQVIPGLVRGLLGRARRQPGGHRRRPPGRLPGPGRHPRRRHRGRRHARLRRRRARGVHAGRRRWSGPRAPPVEPEPRACPRSSWTTTGKPTITLPDGDPPTELVAQTLIEGEGAEVEAGQTLTAHYTGIIWPGGEQFDSSWDRGEPAEFPIGVGGVIPGWDEGLVGQTVGSQMLLVIPPDQGYGPEGNPQAGIEGTDTLVFVVDILAAA